MTRGQDTRHAILERATWLATRVGVSGLSIGRLAEELGLSKSGLFAHFRSKDALSEQVVQFAAQRFVERVIRPGLSAPRGEPRLRALFERWLGWSQQSHESGAPAGCFFVSAAAELDDVPCRARNALVSHQKDWLDVLANVVRTGIAERHFRANLDAEQLAFELYGTMLMYHMTSRLLHEPQAEARTRCAFEALITHAKSA